MVLSKIILLLNIINRNQNVLENLRLGVYSSFRSYFNPVNFAFTHPEKGVFKMDDYINNTKNLGEKFEFPPISEESEKLLVMFQLDYLLVF